MRTHDGGRPRPVRISQQKVVFATNSHPGVVLVSIAACGDRQTGALRAALSAGKYRRRSAV